MTKNVTKLKFNGSINELQQRIATFGVLKSGDWKKLPGDKWQFVWNRHIVNCGYGGDKVGHWSAGVLLSVAE